MDEELNGLEILKIAEQVQEGARDFYQEAASLFAHHSNLFLELVLLEDDFGRAVARMKEDFLRKNKNSTVPDDSLFRSVVGLHVFVRAEPSKLFLAKMRKEQIITIVLKIEQDLNKYLEGLKNFTADENAVAVLRSIVDEKKRQINAIKDWLER